MRTAFSLVLFCSGLVAQAGDRGGEVQKPPPESWDIPEAPARSWQEELETFSIKPGYRIELAASEPLVEDPIEVRFGADGAMWVTEMRGFMPNVDGEGEKEPNGRISVLRDKDGDGVYEDKTVFLDKLPLPRGVMPVYDGAIVLLPPRFEFVRDTDGDGVADERTVIGEEYENGFKNPEHAVNTPTWGLDNWIYFARYGKRLRREASGQWTWESVPSGGQWGLSMGDQGEWYFNTNSQHLRGHLAPPHYGARHPHLPGAAFANQNIGPDQSTYPIRINPGVNRGYRKGTLREDGTLARFTAVCGPGVYRGALMPEFAGDVFVVEPSGNFVRRNKMAHQGTGWVGRNAYDKSEFWGSTDERFRPVNATTGPDGALYVVDLYRGVLQHRNYVTSYLRKQILERKLELPVHLGRIWRVVPDRQLDLEPQSLVGLSPVQLVARLAHPNGWVRDTAQRLLVQRGDRGVAGALKRLARESDSAVGRIHAMWVLDGLGAMDRATVLTGLRHTDAMVRAQAVRLAESRLNGEKVDALVLGVLRGMVDSETNARVRLQLAFSLGEVSRHDAPGRAGALESLSGILLAHGADVRMRDAVVSGAFGDEMMMMRSLLAAADNKDVRSAAQQGLRRLASCVFRARERGRMVAVLELVAEQERGWCRTAMLDGVGDALPRKGARKIPFGGRPGVFDKLAAFEDGGTKKRVDRLVSALAFGEAAGPRALTDKERELFTQGEALYLAQCAACHQPTGRGMDGVAPPLRGSEWVLGSTQRLARILLNGMTGPVEVAGKRYEFAMMPDHARLTDTELASLMTYVRRGWDHVAEPVQPQLVETVRSAVSDRGQPWTAAELQQINDER